LFINKPLAILVVSDGPVTIQVSHGYRIFARLYFAISFANFPKYRICGYLQ